MSRARPVRTVTGVLLWLAAVVGATAAGMAAVGMIGSDIFDQGQTPLSAAEVDDRLATLRPTGTPPAQTPSGQTPSSTPDPTPTDPTPSDTPESTPPPSTPAAGHERVMNVVAGTVIARCLSNGAVDVLGATPAQGYEVEMDDDDDDEGGHPTIKFEGDDREVEVSLRCVNGTPEPEIRTDDD